VRFANPLPWWGLLPLLSLVAWVSARAWREAGPLPLARRVTMTGLRAAVLLALLALVMRPVTIQPAVASRDAVVAILVDASRSMQLRDGAGGGTRAEEAVDLVRRRVLPALDGRVAVETLRFGERLEPTDLAQFEAGDARSDLAAALRDLTGRLQGRSLAGIVVVSDGAVAEPAPGVPAAAPVFAVGTGSPDIARDREVSGATIGDPSVAESVLDLTATVVSHGYADAAFDVRLLEDGRPAGVRRVRPIAGGAPVQVTFRVSPRRDRATVYTVDVPAADDELTAGNNRRSVLAAPPGRPRRLLMLEGAPGFDHSFLKRALESDVGVHVDAVIRKGQNDQGEVTYYVQAPPERTSALVGGFPANRAALFGYDALVLANLGADVLTAVQLEAVRAFVAERGGGLILLGARSFDARAVTGTALEELLPLRLAGEAVESASLPRSTGEVTITPDGARHPIMRLGAPDSVDEAWNGLPALASVARLGGPRPGAAVLARATAPGGGARALVAVQRYGRGRVLAFAGESSWRWRMMLPSSDRRYETFWRQAARWVSAPAPDPVSVDAVSRSRESAEVGVTVCDATFAPVRGATVAVRITGPGGRTSEHAASLRDAGAAFHLAEVSFSEPGPYRIEAVARRGEQEVGRSETWLLAGAADPELSDPRRNDDVLERVARASDGRLLGHDQIATLPELLRRRPAGETPAIERDLWHGPWTWLTLAGCLCAEWFLRRRWGLR
jgi:uncharacterized membrane protein